MIGGVVLPSSSFRSAAPLVGRADELSDLADRLGLTAPGQDRSGPANLDDLPTVVLLSGDAGVGKTRLLTELRDRAQDAGWTVLAGHCLDLGDAAALPYLPFSEILGRIEQDPGADHAALATSTLARLLPTSRARGAAATSSDVDRLDRADIFAAVHAVLDRAATAEPLLVVIEDAHWADQSSRELLSFLFSRSYAGRLALVVSYRSDDLHRRHPLRRQVADWARLPSVSRLSVEPLSPDAVRELVARLHTSPLPATAVDSIIARAEGNAFFVEELVGAASGPEGWVPPELADVLLIRLDRLDEAARSVVRAASVAGRSVSHELLTAVSGLVDGDLDAAIRSAVEAHVLTIKSDNRYLFRHALLAEAVYDDLLPGERTRIHAAYADVMSDRRDLASAAELARHARLAADLDTALVASIEAGHEAMALGGPDEAAMHYERALAMLADARLASRVVVDLSQLVNTTAKALSASGHPDRALKLVDDHLARLPADAQVSWRVRMLATRADTLSLVETVEVPANVSAQAVALLDDEPTRLRAHVLAIHARLSHYRGDDATAEEIGLEALALAERHNLDKLASDVITTLSALKRRGPTDALRAALNEAIASARSAGAVNAEMRAEYLLGRSYMDWGEIDQALESFAAVQRIGAAVGIPWSTTPLSSLWNTAIIEYGRGNWATAEELTRLGPSAPRLARLLMESVRLSILAARGEETGEAVAALRSSWTDEGALALYSGFLEIVSAPTADRVLEVYDDVAEVLATIWHPRFAGRVRLSTLVIGRLGDLAATSTAEQQRDLDEVVDDLATQGRAVVERYSGNANHWGPEGRAWAARLEADVLRWHWLTGTADPDPEPLVSAWRDAEAAFVAFGHVYELAVVRATYAEILRATGDAPAARAIADQARETARALGARPLLDRLGPGYRTTPRDQVSDLTPREEEVLALVAQGRTNGEIGKQLFISTKTVSVHVSNILAKLGAASRTEAAAIAHRRAERAE